MNKEVTVREGLVVAALTSPTPIWRVAAGLLGLWGWLAV